MTCWSKTSHSLCAAVLITLTTGAITTTASAVPYTRIQAIDSNGNGIIDEGEEFFALARLRNEMNSTQLVAYEEHLVEPSPAGLLVTRFDSSGLDKNLRQQCILSQRFFLQESVSDISLTHASFVKPTRSGASVSMTRDRHNDLSSWKLKGAVALIGPGSNKCLTSPPADRLPGAMLTGFAYAPYVEFNGSGESNRDTDSSLVFGVKNELRVLDGLFDFQEFSMSPFYQTDFNFDTEIYGVRGDWTPYVLDWHLNSYRKEETFNVWWSFKGIADFRTVKKAGNTALKEGEDYGWLGAEIGAKASYGQFFADVNLSAFHNVLADGSAIKFDTSVGVYLSVDKRTSLKLKYQSGTEYKTIRDIEDISLTINVAF